MKNTKKSLPEYDTYRFAVSELFLYIGIWFFISAVFAYFFYKSVIAFVIIAAFFPLFLSYVRKELIRKRDWQMTLEFKELLRIVATDLEAGSSVENAFVWAAKEMKNMYPKKSVMRVESEIIANGLANNIVIEELVSSLAQRTGNEEINDFSQIFSAAKRCGCSLREIINEINEAIDIKTETKREFRVLIASKKFEHRILCAVPFIIMGYMSFTTPGYFKMLYGNVKGVGIMTCCMAVYMGAFIWGERIANITF